MSLPIIAAALSMNVDEKCSRCHTREVPPDQVGEPWRVCSKCAKNPDQWQQDLEAKLGVVEKKKLSPEKSTVVRMPLWITVVGLIVITVVGAIAAIDWSSVAISDEVWDDILSLVVFAFTLSIIVGVMSYVFSAFRRF